MKWKCPNCYTEYEVDRKFEKALEGKKNCKFCVRKDPNVPTTAEMDGLLTVEDMRIRDQVMMQCVHCNKWTQMTHKEETKYVPCHNCGKTAYDHDSRRSLRTYNPEREKKRRVKVAIKRIHESQEFNKGS